MSHARHEHRIGGAVVDGHAHIDGGNLDPAHHGVAVEGELPFIAHDLGGVHAGGKPGKLVVVSAGLVKVPLLFLGRHGIHTLRDLGDGASRAVGRKEVGGPGPYHQGDAAEDKDRRNQALGPSGQASFVPLAVCAHFCGSTEHNPPRCRTLPKQGPSNGVARLWCGLRLASRWLPQSATAAPCPACASESCRRCPQQSSPRRQARARQRHSGR